MTPFKASAGVVDRIAGLPLPRTITLYAILLTKRPNLDGTGFLSSDIVSDRPVAIDFECDRHELRNKTVAQFHLVEGSWRNLYIQLHDETGEPFGKGMVTARGNLEHWIRASAETIIIAPSRPM